LGLSTRPSRLFLQRSSSEESLSSSRSRDFTHIFPSSTCWSSEAPNGVWSYRYLVYTFRQHLFQECSEGRCYREVVEALLALQKEWQANTVRFEDQEAAGRGRELDLHCVHLDTSHLHRHTLASARCAENLHFAAESQKKAARFASSPSP